MPSVLNSFLSVRASLLMKIGKLFGDRKQSEVDHKFGLAPEVWEGYAGDPEICH